MIGAELEGVHITSLVHRLYSQNAPGFVSENEEILGAVRDVSRVVGNRGISLLSGQKSLKQLRDGQCGDGEVVRQEDELLAGGRIEEADPPQGIGIPLAGVESGERDGLIEPHSLPLADRMRVASAKAEVLLGPSDEESPGSVNAMQAGEVQIAAVHEVECSWRELQLIEDVHVVDLAGSYDDRGGEVPAQGEQAYAA